MPGPWEQYQQPSSPAPQAPAAPDGPWTLYQAPQAAIPAQPSEPAPDQPSSLLEGVEQGIGSFLSEGPVGQAVSAIKGLGEGVSTYLHNVAAGKEFEDPITYTIHHGILGPMAENAAVNLKKLPSDLREGDYAQAFADAVGAVPVVGALKPVSEKLGTALAGYYDPKSNSIVVDPKEVGDAVGSVAGQALNVWLGAHPSIATETPEVALNKAKQATEYLVDKAASKAAPSDLLMGALRKDAPRRLDFNQQLEDYAMPAIKEVADATGRKIDGLDSLIRTGDRPGLIDLAKKEVQRKIDAIEGPRRAMGKQFDSEELASTIRDQITDTMRRQDPAKARSLSKMAARYSKGNLSVDDMYNELTNLNAKLDAYYAKNPAARRLQASANPDIAVDDALARKVREMLYAWEDDPKVGQSLRTARQQYGSLKQLENSLYQRRLTLQRSAPMDLSEKMSKWSGSGNLAKGLVKTIVGSAAGHPGMALGGAADIAAGAAKVAAGKWLENYTSTDALINRAFAKPIKASPHIEVPPPFKPKGLLESGTPRIENEDRSGPIPFHPPPEYSQPPFRNLLTENPATASGKRITINADQFNVRPPKGGGTQRLLGTQTMSHVPGEVQELVPIRDRQTGKIIYVPKNKYRGFLLY